MTVIIRSFHLRNMPINGDSSSSPKLQMFVKVQYESCMQDIIEGILKKEY